MPSTKPSIKRHVIRKSHQFRNSFLPLIEIPTNNPITIDPSIINHITNFVDSYGIQEPCKIQKVQPKIQKLQPKSIEVEKNVEITTNKNRQQRKPRQPKLDYTEYSSDLTDGEEVYMNYNASNTPKFIGKFVNISVANRIKRKCKTCGAIYNDLKGFNRHFSNKHQRS